jgi:Sigma-70, region 4
MPDETWPARVQRAVTMQLDRDAGMSLAAIGRKHGVSRERVRQVLAAGRPKPVGWSRADEMPTTRVRERLEYRIAQWSQWTDDPAAAELVAKWKKELAALDEQKQEDVT